MSSSSHSSKRSNQGKTPSRYQVEPAGVRNPSCSPKHKKCRVPQGGGAGGGAADPVPPSPPGSGGSVAPTDPPAPLPPTVTSGQEEEQATSEQEDPKALPEITRPMLLHCLSKRQVVILQEVSGCSTKTGTHLKRVDKLWHHCNQTSDVIWDAVRSLSTVVAGNGMDAVRDITDRLSSPGAARIAQGHELARVAVAEATTAAKENVKQSDRAFRDKLLALVVSDIKAGAQNSRSMAGPGVVLHRVQREHDTTVLCQDAERLTTWPQRPPPCRKWMLIQCWR